MPRFPSSLIPFTVYVRFVRALIASRMSFCPVVGALFIRISESFESGVFGRCFLICPVSFFSACFFVCGFCEAGGVYLPAVFFGQCFRRERSLQESSVPERRRFVSEKRAIRNKTLAVASCRLDQTESVFRGASVIRSGDCPGGRTKTMKIPGKPRPRGIRKADLKVEPEAGQSRKHVMLHLEIKAGAVAVKVGVTAVDVQADRIAQTVRRPDLKRCG